MTPVEEIMEKIASEIAEAIRLSKLQTDFHRQEQYAKQMMRAVNDSGFHGCKAVGYLCGPGGKITIQLDRPFSVLGAIS